MKIRKVIANISNRHCHLTQKHLEVLFGPDASLTRLRDLIQPGQYACEEKVTISTSGGELHNVRIIGPVRSYTQVEISRTDSFLLKIKPEPPVRDSGKLTGSSPITLIGPAGRIDLKEGCIIAKRHVHFSPSDASLFGVKDGQLVKIRAGGRTGRTVIFEEVLCRVGENMALECHLDTDEANACGLNNGDEVEIIF